MAERPLTLIDLIAKAIPQPLKDMAKGLYGGYKSLSELPTKVYSSKPEKMKEAEARLTGKTLSEVMADIITEKKIEMKKPEVKKTEIKKPEEIKKSEETLKDYYREFLKSSLEQRKELMEEIKDYSKRLEEVSKGMEKTVEKIKKELEEIPRLPDLPELPTPPKKFDTWKKLSNHTKGLLSLVILALTIRGISEGVPEMGLVAWGGMLDAIRRRDEEDFKTKMEEYKASLERIRLETEKILREYEWKLKEWQTTKYEPLKFELEEKKLDYDLAKFAYEQVNKQLRDLDEIIRDTYKNIFQAEKFEWQKFIDWLELQVKLKELPYKIEERKARTKAYEARAREAGLLGLSPEETEGLEEIIKERLGKE